MDRRALLEGLGACAAASLLPATAVRAAQAAGSDLAAARLEVSDERLATLPAEFMGLGYEISSAAQMGLLSERNTHYVRLVRTLGAGGVIRIGGNTSDDATYSASAEARSAPVGGVVNQRGLEDLGGFLRATGWRLIWGLNLATGSKEAAAEEAAAVTRGVGGQLLAFEIGNEPDFFPGNPKHRPKQYGYDDYLQEFRAYRATILAKLPGAVFAGPDAGERTEWVERFAADEGRSVTLLTEHYYREQERPTSTLDNLLQADARVVETCERLRRASAACGKPYRICEVNSFSGGGRPGVSDTFGAALWVLDYMCLLASHGCAGVNLQTGMNQRGFVSSYSPIGDDLQGHQSATPEFYGMLAFAAAGGGEVMRVTWDPGAVNATAYAFRSAAGATRAVVINKDRSQGVTVQFAQPVREVLRLRAPSLEARSGVTLGEATIADDGTWRPRAQDPMPEEGRHLAVPAGSAAVVRLG